MRYLAFKKKNALHYPIKIWRTDTTTEVAIYQGERGHNPQLDFIVKYKEENKRLRTPSHTHWIVDLLVKGERGKKELSLYINDMIDVYDSAEPFKTIEHRDNYELRYPQQMVSKHSILQGKGYYSVETITSFIELFSICEKQTPDAFMFRGLLTLLKDYSEGKKDFYQIVGLSKRV